MEAKQEYDIEGFIHNNDTMHLDFSPDMDQKLAEILASGGFSDFPGLGSEEETLASDAVLLPLSALGPLDLPRGPPERGNFSGELQFEVRVNSADVSKKKYLYSGKLNRIYVDMGVNFSMHFHWRPPAPPGPPAPLLVRATTVFSDDAQAQKRVERCLQHKHSASAAHDPPGHVLRSARELGTAGVHYSGAPAHPDDWYSVLVELPAPHGGQAAPHGGHAAPHGGHAAPQGASCSHAYQFLCKNSCSSGINRRAIDIVFSLEDASGKVLGRQSVGARVCSCLRRDLQKDEETAADGAGAGKRRLNTQVEKPSKKVKLDPADSDEQLYTLPHGIQVVGSKTLTTGLTVMYNMMEQMAAAKRSDARAQEKYSKALASVRSVLDKFKTK